MDQFVYTTSPLTATVPEGAMGLFLGTNPNGLWWLRVADTSAGASGRFNSWSLDLTTGHCLLHQYLPVVRK
jgi:subtilisin-like proprotein convertase family protein